MPSADEYRSVKLEHGERVDQIKNFTQQDWMKACATLGLFVSEGNGKGSHAAVYKSKTCPPSDSSCLILTIVHRPYPNIQRDYVKKLVAYGLSANAYNEEDVWVALGIAKGKRVSTES